MKSKGGRGDRAHAVSGEGADVLPGHAPVREGHEQHVEIGSVEPHVQLPIGCGKD